MLCCFVMKLQLLMMFAHRVEIQKRDAKTDFAVAIVYCSDFPVARSVSLHYV